MKSLTAFAALALTLAIAAPAAPAAVPSPRQTTQSDVTARRRALNDLFTQYWEDRLSHSPEFASTIGDNRFNDQLTDDSVDAYNQQLARGRDFLTRLGQIDTTGLSDQEVLSKDLLVRELIEQQEESRFKPWEMPVNQFSGLQLSLPQLAARLSFTSAKDYDDYIARLNKIPTAFRQITDNMLAGVDDHRVPPKYLLEKVLVQVNAIAAQKPEDSPFARPLKQFPAGISAADQTQIHDQVLAAIAKQVIPAYQRFAKFLEGVYIPAGRTDPGVDSLPDGAAYYAFLVQQSTTTDIPAAQIHQIGLDQVKEDEGQELVIAKRLGYPTIAALRAAIAANPKLHPTSANQLLDAFRGYINGMRPKLPDLFTHLPKAPLVVEAIPAWMAKDQAPAYYEEGTPDGSRPGTVFVNTYDYAHRSLATVESIAYHEGIPGHHLQISLAQELTDLPAFRRYLHYTAFTEGWGLYAEHLGKDIGFYQDPYSDFGRLESDEFRAIRLVVDTGVHSQRWTRQQMVDYFHAHSGLDDATINAEVDRDIAWPALALGYKLGAMEILALRDRAQHALGPKFDLRTFDDEIIDSGPLPLDVLDQRVTDWIAVQRKAN
ncbi:MAG TPA: DUF885 domain-containing protein [Acidobacteriaceae bacterium]|jgi:uncharacterized protein (DUF885 family)|nr:DUF885 domain-containing protein [Acidobacteriaceae bacterium]